MCVINKNRPSATKIHIYEARNERLPLNPVLHMESTRSHAVRGEHSTRMVKLKLEPAFRKGYHKTLHRAPYRNICLGFN